MWPCHGKLICTALRHIWIRLGFVARCCHRWHWHGCNETSRLDLCDKSLQCLLLQLGRAKQHHHRTTCRRLHQLPAVSKRCSTSHNLHAYFAHDSKEPKFYTCDGRRTSCQRTIIQGCGSKLKCLSIVWWFKDLRVRADASDILPGHGLSKLHGRTSGLSRQFLRWA